MLQSERSGVWIFTMDGLMSSVHFTHMGAKTPVARL